MIQNYQNYLDEINSEHPSFMKHVSGSNKQIARTNRAEGQSKVRTFFKKFSKRQSAKVAIERTSSENLWGSLQDLTSSPETSMVFEDDSRLCINLLISRLFFDAQNNNEMNNSIQSRIQVLFYC